VTRFDNFARRRHHAALKAICHTESVVLNMPFRQHIFRYTNTQTSAEDRGTKDVAKHNAQGMKKPQRQDAWAVSTSLRCIQCWTLTSVELWFDMWLPTCYLLRADAEKDMLGAESFDVFSFDVFSWRSLQKQVDHQLFSSIHRRTG